jgi:hypothetical protein
MWARRALTALMLASLGALTACGGDDLSEKSAVLDASALHEAATQKPATVPRNDAAIQVADPPTDAPEASTTVDRDDGAPFAAGVPFDPADPRTESIAAGTVKLGWDQLDIGRDANYEVAADANDPTKCPDPDAMVTKGTVDYQDGTYTLTGSGEGFIHGWDQGNLVYFKTKIHGDFTYTAKVDKFEMINGRSLDGAAEALLNVRQDLGYRQPTQSIIAGSAPAKYMFMARYYWTGDPNNKWWHWPAWPVTWPSPRPLLSWTRITRRGNAFAAYGSTDGQSWEVINHNDTDKSHPDWYPFQLDTMPADVYIGLVCSARNDRNYAAMAKLPGKNVDCRDSSSDFMRGSARCVFSHITLSQP